MTTHYKPEETGAFIETFTIAPTNPGVLDGLRFAVKDLIDIGGYKTSCGNPTWRDTHPIAAANAVCVDQLLAAGGTCIGKTVTDELAFSLIGENHFYGAPLNPRAPDRVSGGSSSGSASAVACGLADFALGTDTGGSVRVPASNCGIYGIRPSHGAVSVAGVNPFAPTYDVVGVLARDARVLADASSVLLSQEVPSSVDVGRIHLLTDAFALSDPDVRDALSGSIEKLKRHFPGKVGEVSLKDIVGESHGEPFDAWYETYCTLQWAEVRSCLGSWIDDVKPEFGPRVRMNFELTRNLDRREINAINKRREIYSQRLHTFLGSGDLICMPTAPAVAPVKGSLGDDRTACSYYPRALSLTAVAGVGRLPQVSMPLAETNEAPIGLSLLARRWMDAFLLGVVLSIASEFQ